MNSPPPSRHPPPSTPGTENLVKIQLSSPTLCEHTPKNASSAAIQVSSHTKENPTKRRRMCPELQMLKRSREAKDAQVSRREDEEGVEWLAAANAEETNWEEIRQLYTHPLVVRVIKDCGMLQTALNGKLLLKPYTQLSLVREELLTDLINNGSLLRVHDEP
eukprot:TRINITY_DN17128_c0_g1_i1.p1 TRINITY_DN17128_c0_g1~~TRINITY_DN17128_c0_g1_i1.p1  ORF type:complete len:162 (+),score=43.44 TRINITY_DN17128_c0_g1_i1:219-704(+)